MKHAFHRVKPQTRGPSNMSVMPCHATNKRNKDESAAKVYLVQLVRDSNACRGGERRRGFSAWRIIWGNVQGYTTKNNAVVNIRGNVCNCKIHF